MTEYGVVFALDYSTHRPIYVKVFPSLKKARAYRRYIRQYGMARPFWNNRIKIYPLPNEL